MATAAVITCDSPNCCMLKRQPQQQIYSSDRKESTPDEEREVLVSSNAGISCEVGTKIDDVFAAALRAKSDKIRAIYTAVRIALNATSTQRRRGTIPPPIIQPLLQCLDSLQLEDIGIATTADNKPILNPANTLSYQHVHSDDFMSIGIFIIPAGKRLPLHDHPQMTVFTKLLAGRMQIENYDWLAAPQTHRIVDGRNRLQGAVRLSGSRILKSPSAAVYLTPHSRNLHQMIAVEDSVIFDVLTPPYDSVKGRDCHYFQVTNELEGDSTSRRRRSSDNSTTDPPNMTEIESAPTVSHDDRGICVEEIDEPSWLQFHYSEFHRQRRAPTAQQPVQTRQSAVAEPTIRPAKSPLQAAAKPAKRKVVRVEMEAEQ